MPSRNRVPNAAELVSRSLNCTSAVSPCKRSDMLNASRNCSRLFTYNRLGDVPAYDEQMIARPRAEVQPQPLLWFPDDAMTERRCKNNTRKKEPPFPAAFEVDNREASNRVDRSHSVSKQGQAKS